MKHFRPALLLLVCLAVLVWQLSAQEVTDQEEAHRQALITVATEVTNGNFEIVYQHTAEDYVVHTPLGDMDGDAVVGLFTSLSNALTDFEMVRQQVLVEDDLAASRFTFMGVFENEFTSPMGDFPPTGEPFALEVINIFQFDDNGMIVEEWVQYDALSFLTQLGAIGGEAE